MGDITDRGRPTPPDLNRIGPEHWSVDGGVPVTDLADELGASFPEGEWLTVAGLVIGLAGRIPAVGDRVQVPGFTLRVSAAGRRRVRRVEVTVRD